MKKIMILAAAAALVLSAACTKSEITSSLNDEETPIMFTNYAPKALTKAEDDYYVAANALVNGAQFDVYGWFTANNVSFNGSNGAKFMDWYTVTYQTGGNTNGATNLYPDGYRYWPSGDTPDKLSFYAYYPSNGSGITAPTAGLGDFTFTAQSTAATQVDFMVADVVKDQLYKATNSGTDGTVKLTFKHMLTRVQFKFKTTSEIVEDTHTNITVTGATLGNICNTGKLTTSYDGTDFGTGWNNVSGTASYNDVYYPTTALTASANEVAADNIYLMVPQTLVPPTRDGNGVVTSDTGAQYITVSWKVVTDGVTTNNSAKLYLDEFKTTENGNTQVTFDWTENMSVTYTITIAPQKILFTAVAESWADWSTNGYINVN